jgi:hypothetical protein
MGLAMGVALSLPVGVTVILASTLAYASGFGLTMWPYFEVAMNVVDYAMGGTRVKSLFAPRYWEALAVASLAGFLAAWPVNFWLLGRRVKKCH